MKTTIKYLARTGRRLRAFLSRIAGSLANNGKFTLRVKVVIPLVAEVEASIEYGKKPR